jgi:DNA-binding response OmpR family regulator
MAKVLIVDDDKDFLESITLILQDAGYSYIATADSKTVEKKVRSYRPNVVLLDVFLEDDNGKNIAQELKNTFDTRAVPIVLVSGNQNNVDSLIKTGCIEAYLKKPFSSQELKNILANLSIKKQKINLL